MSAALHVLLVEDSAADARVVQEELHGAAPGEVTLTRARTAAAAAARLAAERVDCVLLNLSLPDAEGLAAIETLRAVAPDTPVVVLSGLAADQLAVQAVVARAQEYLVKGETSGLLLVRAIRSAVERKSGERRLAALAMSDALTGPPKRALLLDRDTVARFGGNELGVLCEHVDDRCELDQPAAGLSAAVAELDGMLRRGELIVHYEPQVALPGGRALAGVEALVHRRHPEPGLVGPEQLLGAAEDSGLIRRLGAWVLSEACRQLAVWRAQGLGGDTLTMAVNVSPRELADDAFVARVAAALAEHELPAGALCLEVPESVLRDAGDVRARLGALRDAGVRIAVDDVGAGWSSLSALSPFPADAVKIDRRVVAGLAGDAQAGHVVAAVVGLARSLGLQPLAAGVETQELARALARLGVEVAQGPAFSAACSAPAIEALLAADGRPEAQEPAGPARVFLCDDAPGLRALLRVSLELDGDLTVVGEAGDGAGLAGAVREAAADVVLLDLSMPNVDGLEALVELRAADAEVAVIVLSGFDARRMEAQALALGADRYVEKTAAMHDIAAAVREVMAARRGPRPLLEAFA